MKRILIDDSETAHHLEHGVAVKDCFPAKIVKLGGGLSIERISDVLKISPPAVNANSCQQNTGLHGN